MSIERGESGREYDNNIFATRTLSEPIMEFKEFSPNEKKLINRLFTSECMQFGDFKLTSGRPSFYKLDMAHAQHDPALTRMIVTEFSNVIKNKYCKPDIISPVPSASVPTVSLVAAELGLPMMTVRIKEFDKEKNEHVIDGFTQSSIGKEAIVSDDAGTTGGSIKTAVEALRKKKVVVKRALVLLDRQEGAYENLAAENIELMSVFKSTDMFRYALDAKTSMGQPIVSEENRDLINRYFAQKLG